jgi:hypothetical protein
MRPDFVGEIIIERTRMRLFVLNTDLDQVFQDQIAFNFQFTRQFVDPYLPHAKFFFSLALAQTLGYGNLPAGSIKALAALFHAPPPPSPDVAGFSLLSPSPSPSGVLVSLVSLASVKWDDSSGADVLSTAVFGPVASSPPVASSGADASSATGLPAAASASGVGATAGVVPSSDFSPAASTSGPASAGASTDSPRSK